MFHRKKYCKFNSVSVEIIEIFCQQRDSTRKEIFIVYVWKLNGCNCSLSMLCVYIHLIHQLVKQKVATNHKIYSVVHHHVKIYDNTVLIFRYPSNELCYCYFFSVRLFSLYCWCNSIRTDVFAAQSHWINTLSYRNQVLFWISSTEREFFFRLKCEWSRSGHKSINKILFFLLEARVLIFQDEKINEKRRKRMNMCWWDDFLVCLHLKFVELTKRKKKRHEEEKNVICIVRF